MSDRVEQAARVIAWALADRRMDRAGTVYGLDGAAAARALHAEGLLAPAPLREEWTTLMRDGDPARGDTWTCCGIDRATAEADALSGGYDLVHRWVTDWEAAP